MKIPSTYIATTFQLLDTNISAADSFANVRDIKKIRDNYNILYAKRSRKHLLSIATKDLNYYGTKFSNDLPAGSVIGTKILELPIYISQGARTIKVYIRACKSALDANSTLIYDPKIYFTLTLPEKVKEVATTNSPYVEIDAASGTTTTYNTELDVPITAFEDVTSVFGKVPCKFGIYLESRIDDTYSASSSVALTGFGPNYVATAVSGVSVVAGDLINFDSDGSKGQRVVSKIVNLPTETRYYFTRAVNKTPDDTDTLSSSEVLGVDLKSISVFEEVVSLFDTMNEMDY